jgi:hypothetical protein
MQWMDTISPNKLKILKQTSACQKAEGNCFLGQEMSSDSGVYPTRDHDNVIALHCKKEKVLRLGIQNKRCGMLTPGVVLLHDNALSNIESRSRA